MDYIIQDEHGRTWGRGRSLWGGPEQTRHYPDGVGLPMSITWVEGGTVALPARGRMTPHGKVYEVETSQAVVVTAHGRCYHQPDCRHAHGSEASTAEAEDRGLRPCKCCRPERTFRVVAWAVPVPAETKRNRSAGLRHWAPFAYGDDASIAPAGSMAVGGAS